MNTVIILPHHVVLRMLNVKMNLRKDVRQIYLKNLNENFILNQNMFYASLQKIQDILVSLFLLKEYCKEFVSKVTLNLIFFDLS